jgi:hypothetical protein
MITTHYAYILDGYNEVHYTCGLNEDSLDYVNSINELKNGTLVSRKSNIESANVLIHEKALQVFLTRNEIPFKMNVWED